MQALRPAARTGAEGRRTRREAGPVGGQEIGDESLRPGREARHHGLQLLARAALERGLQQALGRWQIDDAGAAGMAARLLHDGRIEEDVLAVYHREGVVREIEHVAVFDRFRRMAVRRLSGRAGPPINLHLLDHDAPRLPQHRTRAAADIVRQRWRGNLRIGKVRA
jgi:hypothetical protein